MRTLREAAIFVLREWDTGVRGHRLDAAIGELWSALKREHEPLTLDKLSNALVMSRLIDKDAIENPEQYDDSVTLDQVRAVYRRLV